jgi:hypothetical protein
MQDKMAGVGCTPGLSGTLVALLPRLPAHKNKRRREIASYEPRLNLSEATFDLVPENRRVLQLDVGLAPAANPKDALHIGPTEQGQGQTRDDTVCTIDVLPTVPRIVVDDRQPRIPNPLKTSAERWIDLKAGKPAVLRQTPQNLGSDRPGSSAELHYLKAATDLLGHSSSKNLPALRKRADLFGMPEKLMGKTQAIHAVPSCCINNDALSSAYAPITGPVKEFWRFPAPPAIAKVLC